MPTIVDNNFVNDTHAMRAERLLSIKSYFALIQPELSASAQIATLAERNHTQKLINPRLKPWADGKEGR